MNYYADVVNRLVGQGYDGWSVHGKACGLIEQGADVILLTIGDPDFDTPLAIVDATIQSLQSGHTHYTPVAGEINLREAIAAHHRQTTGQSVDAQNVVVVQGAQAGLYVAAMCTLQPGDEVILFDPVYSTYPPTIGATGATPVYVSLREERNFHLDPSDVAAAITPKTRAILLNTPHNPTGTVLTRDEVEALAALAREHDLWLITDEVYSYFTYTHPHTSPAAIPAIADRAVTISSLSKSYAMTGWRLGWLVGPTAFIEYATRLLMVMSFSGTGFIQDGAVVALTCEIAEAAEMRAAYHRRVEVVADMLTGVPGIRCRETEGSIYTLLDVRQSGLPSMDFADQLCEEAHVALLPGDAFGPNLQGYLRFSLVASEDRLIEACERIRRFAVERFG